MASKNPNHEISTKKMVTPGKNIKPKSPNHGPNPGKIVNTIDSKGEVGMRRLLFMNAATGKSSFYNGPGFN